jgi:hypothetical protein
MVLLIISASYLVMQLYLVSPPANLHGSFDYFCQLPGYATLPGLSGKVSFKIGNPTWYVGQFKATGEKNIVFTMKKRKMHHTVHVDLLVHDNKVCNFSINYKKIGNR